VISRAIIKWLLINFKNKYWFISTKSWKPNWLISLKNFPLRLLVIPPVAANTARINNELNVWITKNGKPSKYALEISRKFYEDFKFKQEFTTIILPGGLKTLAIQWGDEKSKENGEIIVKHDILTENPIETSMASVFFAASVACLLARKPNLKELIEYSLNFTNRWQQHEIKRFTDPNRWDPQKTPFIVFGKDTTDTNEIQIKKGPLSFDNELNLWKRSLDPAKRGILKDEAYPKERIFELWRAMLEVDGYICCVESKQKSILKLVQAVNNFVELHSIQADRLKQSSCMLYAPPGSGKTSLVKKLAENNKLRFIPFNITQLINRRDILECFDTIVTYYLQNFKEPLLIFVDEINSKIDGEEAYSAFLTPLEDSVYIRGSKTFKLPPCFWIFASTQGEQEIKGETKGSDFCSRLTHGIISLGSMGKENEKRYLENVYVGVAMILASFPDVMSVSDGVLEVFYQFEERTKLREIRHFVEAFENVQYGKVNLSNMPHEWLENKSYARINEIIKTWREKYDVRILV